MLMVKASARPSAVQGIGLFADEKIPKGRVIWEFDPRFDVVFDPAEVGKMSEAQKRLINRCAYLSTTSGKYIYSIDDSRFTNHSSTKNNMDVVAFPREAETRSVANRDIEPGEELLIDYRTFDMHDAASNEQYLNS